MTNTALVIGGTRNLGPDLALALLARGDKVTVLNRGLTPDDLPPEVERLRADRSDAAAFRAALRQRAFDVVIDTTLYTGRDAEGAIETLRGSVGRYVFWSTGQVYLVREQLKPPFMESDYTGPVMNEPPAADVVDHDNWTYGIDKRAAEDRLREAHDSHGFPYVSLRMPMINSARDHYRRLAAYVHRILDGGRIVVPDDHDRLRLRHVYGHDVVEASLRAASPTVPAGSCLNISQDETMRLGQVLRKIEGLLKAACWITPVPRAELDARGLLPACSPWSGRWMSELDNVRSKEVLGLRYTPVDAYLPGLVEAALRIPKTLVPGNDRRREEIALAAELE